MKLKEKLSKTYDKINGEDAPNWLKWVLYISLIAAPVIIIYSFYAIMHFKL